MSSILSRALRNEDVVFPVLLVLLACVFTYFNFERNGYTYFYQNWASESVIYACGHGMNRLANLPLELKQFLVGFEPVFDCALLPEDGYGPPGYWSTVQPALTWGAALSWRIFGVTQSAMIPMLMLLVAGYATACYAFARLFIDPRLSALAATIVTASGPTTAMFWLRDFSKAPFFIWAVVLLLIAIRTRRPRTAMLSAGMAGVAAGLGTNFRIDLVILVPFGLLLLMASVVLIRTNRVGRLISIAVFPLTLYITGYPVVSQLDISSNGGTLVMQGAAEPFRDRLRLAPAGYTLAWEYSDELVLSEVTAVMRADKPDWDNHGTRPGYGTSDAYLHASAYLFSWADMFAADFARQALKSAAWAGWMPAYFDRSLQTGPRYEPDLPSVEQTFRDRGLSLPVVLGLLSFCILIWRQFPHGRAQAILTAFFLVTFAGYTGIQSSLRHVFHVEIVWLVSLLCLLQLRGRWATMRRELRAFSLFAVVTATLGFTALAGLTAWQKAQLSGAVAALLDGPRSAQALTRVAPTPSDPRARLRLPIPAEHRAITDGPRDSSVIDARFVGLQSHTFAAGARLLVTIGGQDCPTTPFKLGLDYALDSEVWLPFSSKLQFTETGAPTRQAIVPVFWRPTQHFDSFVLPESHASCVLSAEQLEADSRLPLIFSAQIDGTGIVGPWHKGFGDFERTARSPGPMRETRPDA